MTSFSSRAAWLGTAALLFGLSTSSLAQVVTDADRLMELARQYQIEEEAAKQEALSLARLMNLPTRQVFMDGTVVELMRFENGRPLYYITENLNSAISIGANHVWPGGSTGFNRNGAGVILGIWDGGTVRHTHQEFQGRAVRRDNEAHGSHATHVGGTMAAGGVNSSARGMSFGATLHSWGWNNDTSEMAAAAAAGLRVSNHSYGSITGWYSSGGTWYWYGNPNHSQLEDSNFGYYGTGARNWDNIAFNAPHYLIVKSAGNDRGQGPSSQPVTHKIWNGSAWVDSTTVRNRDGGPLGYDCLPNSATAKNMMVIGAVNRVVNGYSGPNSVTMSSFSSWGPTDDGRIKPDIVAQGVQLFSSNNTSDTAYATMSGTSMSGPSAAGAMGLIIQHYRELNPGASDMRAATLKGIALHTADECGPNPGPDYTFGWGLLNVRSATQFLSNIKNSQGVLDERTLSNGQSYEFDVVSNGSGPLRISISWTDPAATVLPLSYNNRTSRLVNDLDLRVSRNSTTWMPWRLNPDNPQAAATTGDNTVDNVEQIHIANPQAGTYRIRISHKGSLQGGQQAYSVIVTGANVGGGGGGPAIQSLVVDPSTVVGGQTSTGTVHLTEAAPTGGATVTLTSGSGAITVPASVIVRQGETSASFTVNTNEVGQVSPRKIFANYNGEAEAVLTLLPVSRLKTLTLNPSMVVGGNNVDGIVELTFDAPSGGAVVQLTSGSAAIIVPPSITVAEGQVTASAVIATMPVQTTAVREVYASFMGVTRAASLTLNPGVHPATFTINPSTVFGGDTATGTVTLSAPAPFGGATLQVSSSSSAIVVPPTVAVPPLASSVSFPIETKSVGAVFTRHVVVTLNGVSRAAEITLIPALEMETFTCVPSRLQGGLMSVGSVRLSNPAPVGGASISLVSESGAIIVPETVVVPQGQTEVSFSIQTRPVGAVFTRQVTATYRGKSIATFITLTP
jgi:hypothetical protein